MKVEIRTTYKNAILLRDEILADIFFEGKTPSRIQVHKEIAKKIGAPEDTVIVKSIQSLFGEQKAHAKIFKYDTKDALDKLEPAYLLKRQAKAEKPKTEEDINSTSGSRNGRCTNPARSRSFLNR